MIYTAAPDGLSIDIQRKQLKGALLDRITENDFDIRCNDEEGDYVANDAAYGKALRKNFCKFKNCDKNVII